MTIDERLPEQLLDVHAIADGRDFYRSMCFTASALLDKAPIHHFGAQYEAWKKQVAVWQTAYLTGAPCRHPQEWRTDGICGCCLEKVS